MPRRDGSGWLVPDEVKHWLMTDSRGEVHCLCGYRVDVGHHTAQTGLGLMLEHITMENRRIKYAHNCPGRRCGICQSSP